MWDGELPSESVMSGWLRDGIGAILRYKIVPQQLYKYPLIFQKRNSITGAVL